mmetsp:Transcript_5431/g.15452  ORF Transcript_5431/g.15452 Transcript_5431/m.15452 type:complete len:198 (+) Transcript_5431:172-765(+)
MMSGCSGYRNIGYDIHSYYAFGPVYDRALPLQCFTALFVPVQSFGTWLLSCGRPLTYAEWSLATSTKVKYPQTLPPFNSEMQSFAYAQLRSMQKYEHTARCLGLLTPRRSNGQQGNYMWSFEALSSDLSNHGHPVGVFHFNGNAEDILSAVKESNGALNFRIAGDNGNKSSMSTDILINGWSLIHALRMRWLPVPNI